MTSAERRAGVSLAAIFGLRMLGLFLILPVFSVAARALPGGDNLTLVGLALGAYGLTQALFQIPFGMASDRFGRKPVIVFGLILFALGSLLAAFSTDLYGILAGRIVQGAGAISAAVSALAADLTREQHRTKVMAMIGSSIGLVFAGSLVAAPLLYALIGLSGLFALTGVLALGAILLVLYLVPPAPPLIKPQTVMRKAEVLRNPQLLRLNFGIFCLHLMQMAMFVVVPQALRFSGDLPLAEHWKIYLPAILLSFVLMVPVILFSERHGKVKQVFLAAITLLLLTQIGFLFGRESFPALCGLMVCFFLAFNVLEASLPSLISRTAPAHARGFALGVYNTMQACGLFLGGSLGGWLSQNVGTGAIFVLSSLLALVWLFLAASMSPPPLRRQAPAPSAKAP
ncbi:MAG: MFS transporter [Pseudomonadota bacterium]